MAATTDAIAAMGKLAAPLLALLPSSLVHAQAGPPFLSNDPGTPGNANWEINVAVAPTVTRAAAAYQIPQLDVNYGLGERVQLTYEVPLVVQNRDGAPRTSGWGNSMAGMKWRFFDQGVDGWQVSTFPQIETGGSARAVDKGLAVLGPRYFLPIEIGRTLGGFEVGFEAGEFVPVRGLHETTLGLAFGHPLSSRLELTAELFNDRVSAPTPAQTTLDVGGRCRLRPGFIALFMAGRSIDGVAFGQPAFFGYFGVQILLSDYGRRLNPSP
ncbi:MAG TPA: hypothetical protein VGL28_07930 [Steroidobacteraceae bacterium]|jgi:hypothetical protein